MTKKSNEEFEKSAEEFLATTPPEEMFKLETRICILNFTLPKILWFALESYSKTESISVNELLTSLCNDYLLQQDRQIAMEAALSAGLQSGIDN